MLQSIGYAPYLRSKAAEVSAYRTLAPNVKDVCFPIFGLRPWQNANHLRKTIEKIVEAVGPRPFGLGLDDTAFGQGSSKPAQAEFDALFNSYRGYSGYYDFVSEIENAIPVLVPANSSDALLIQLGNAQSLDRGLVIHQRHNANVPISNYLQQFSDLPSDTIFVVDVGWAPRNMLQMAAWAGSQIQRIIEVAGDAEIVVMGSGFPDSFSHIVGNDDVTIIERQLFAQIRQVYQQANLTFGDWASTRLPQSGGGGKIPSRIDIPTLTSWSIFRSDPDNDLGYGSLLADILGHPAYLACPDCYGKQLVAATNGSGEGVKGTHKATVARINMHLTIHSEFDGAALIYEEDYVD